ncbi:MAG TPA: 50S ribosomal protein L23 [Candidatus Paceibacterota bacterium]|nr:50S ribosomal protein L23 [Candidatus Paceibacterota bacterium]
MKNIFIIKRPHITEKATDLSNIGKYVFMVEPSATKNEVKKAVKKIYGVDVVKIQTITRQARKKSARNRRGAKASYKKAIVGLKEGQKIEIN